jgi:hypothetical protein
MRFLSVYQYVVPIVLFPLSYWLWWQREGGSHRCTLLLLSMPVLFAYLIPALGTNWLGLWEFHTRWRLGKFRPHHGFVFGTATSLFALLCVDGPATSFRLAEVFRSAFILGSVLAFWNWLYDIYAIRAGFIVVYNRLAAEGRGPEAIATDYAPILFGAFGACYGAAIRVAESYLLDQHDWGSYGWLLVLCNLAGLVLPVALFVAWSYVRTGSTGLRPVKGG